MFNISGMEFLVIVVVAIAVVPAKNWPDVARAFGKLVGYIRRVSGKIQDGINELESELSKDLPVDGLSQKTMDDMIETFSTPAKSRTGKKCKK
jgi:Sec-independent protein translocase protein TatA